MAIEGTASVTDIALPIHARIKDKFSGDVKLTTWTSSIAFFAGGGLRVDIEHPQLTMAKAAELGKDKTFRIGKLGADSLSYTDTAGGHLYVKGPYIQDLEFKQTVNGVQAIWLTVKAADLRQLDYSPAGGGSVSIPTLDFADAYLEVNLAALRAAAPKGGTPAPSSFDLSKLRPVVNQINGSVSVVIYLSKSIGDLKDIRIGSTDDPLVVPIQKGQIDIPTFEKNIKGKVVATDIGDYWIYLRPWVVSHEAKRPILRLDGPQLQLGIYYIDPKDIEKGNDPDLKNRPSSWRWKPILTWDLHGVDLDRARADRFSLWTAIFDMHHAPLDPDPDKAKADEAAMQALMDSLEIRKLVADLSVLNRGPLPIEISSDAAKGTVTLSDKALMNLHVEGGIPAVRPPWQRPGLSDNPRQLDVSLEALTVNSVNLTLYDRAPDPADPGGLGKITGLSGLKTGSIRINELSNASLTFDTLFAPHTFKGTIRNGHAENVRWFKY